jgi:pimeloyl-ACP methyl ester carboxylesterase
MRKLVLENPYPQSLENQIRQFRVLEKFNGEPRLKTLKARTLIVCGNEDIIALPQESAHLSQRISRSKLVKLDCGHASIHEKPAELTRILVNFLKR